MKQTYRSTPSDVIHDAAAETAVERGVHEAKPGIYYKYLGGRHEGSFLESGVVSAFENGAIRLPSRQGQNSLEQSSA